MAPLVEVTYKKLYVQGIQAGYHFFDTGKFSLDARAGIVFNGLDPDDSPFLEGMNKRRSTIEGGFVFDWKPGKYPTEHRRLHRSPRPFVWPTGVY